MSLVPENIQMQMQATDDPEIGALLAIQGLEQQGIIPQGTTGAVLALKQGNAVPICSLVLCSSGRGITPTPPITEEPGIAEGPKSPRIGLWQIIQELVFIDDDQADDPGPIADPTNPGGPYFP